MQPSANQTPQNPQDGQNAQASTASNASATPPEKGIGKGVTNPRLGSHEPAVINSLVINLFFDGTWNSRYNSDRYNDPNNTYHVGEIINKPENQKNSSDFYNYKEESLSKKLLKKEYREEETSFSRAPSTVDQMGRGFKGDNNTISLYVDGSGAVTPEKVDATNHKEKNTNIYKDGTNFDTGRNYTENSGLEKKNFSGDSFWGAGLGMGHTPIASWDFFNTGVKSKLEQMFAKIYNALQQKNVDSSWSISFNVYGFSRGATTGRMFVHRILQYKNDDAIKYEVNQMLKSLTFEKFNVNFNVKFVGLFDAVSSIGGNHDNERQEKQDLVFGEKRPVQVVHLMAGHEFRQKFSGISIQSAVQAGCGFEVILPGCHTDIGDGLDTHWRPDKDTTSVTGSTWVLRHFDDGKAICQRYHKVGKLVELLTAIKQLTPLQALDVVRHEESALRNLQDANFTQVRQHLLDQHWFTEDEITIKSDAMVEKLVIKRNFSNGNNRVDKISGDYPKIVTHIMLEILKKNGETTHYDMSKYDVTKVGQAQEVFTAICNDLTTQVSTLYDNYINSEKKLHYCTSNNINNNEQQTTSNYIDVKEELKPILYHDYLHWSSGMDEKPLNVLFTQVNTPYINSHTNQFYRMVYPL